MTIALYSALSGAQASQTRLDVSAHNVANFNTPGFKSSRLGQSTLPGQTGTQVASISRNHSQGSLQHTGIESDRAVAGEGLFEVAAGIYTRNGAFSRTADGSLRERNLVGFRNPGGLLAQGNSTYTTSPASGPAEAANGTVHEGYLEASNTDLATETLQQILAQRSFEANLATIRTVDEMTETLLDIKA